MTTPIETLFALNDAERELDMLQSWIDRARVYAGSHQAAQLVLDRRQRELDDDRAQIVLARTYIASCN